MHRFPWHVMRHGRTIELGDDGRRFYRDAQGAPVFEWSDDDVEPAVRATWEEAIAAERRRRNARSTRPIRPRR